MTTKMKHKLAWLDPSTWIQLHPYSETWDRELNSLLDNNSFEDIEECLATLGGLTIWTESHPYASFRPHNLKVRAKRSTVSRAHEKLISDHVAKKEGGAE